jgi:DUF1009 family protein
VSTTLGLIAGEGVFPHEIARAARRQGRSVAAVAFRDLTAPELEAEVSRVCWLRLGEVEPLFAFFRETGVGDAVIAGKFSKTFLYRELGALRPDARALELLARLEDRRDESILGVLAQALKEEGVRLAPQAGLVPELLVAEGVLSRAQPTRDQWRDIAFAWPIAKSLGKWGIGQSVVVQDRVVLAVEAIEGTDAAIRRAGQLGRPGACVVKVARPRQDPRFDLPTIGPGTLASAVAAKAAVLAFEAHRTVVLQRGELVERADAEGVALVAVGSEGPGSQPDARGSSGGSGGGGEGAP